MADMIDDTEDFVGLLGEAIGKVRRDLEADIAEAREAAVTGAVGKAEAIAQARAFDTAVRLDVAEQAVTAMREEVGRARVALQKASPAEAGLLYDRADRLLAAAVAKSQEVADDVAGQLTKWGEEAAHALTEVTKAGEEAAQALGAASEEGLGDLEAVKKQVEAEAVKAEARAEEAAARVEARVEELKDTINSSEGVLKAHFDQRVSRALEEVEGRIGEGLEAVHKNAEQLRSEYVTRFESEKRKLIMARSHAKTAANEAAKATEALEEVKAAVTSMAATEIRKQAADAVGKAMPVWMAEETRLRWRGVWEEDGEYALGDITMFMGATWVLAGPDAHPGDMSVGVNRPGAEGSVWQLFASGGAGGGFTSRKLVAEQKVQDKQLEDHDGRLSILEGAAPAAVLFDPAETYDAAAVVIAADPARSTYQTLWVNDTGGALGPSDPIDANAWTALGSWQTSPWGLDYSGSGKITGGALTLNGNSIDVEAGTGLIVDASDPAAPVVHYVAWAAQTVPLTLAAAYIMVDTGGAAAEYGVPTDREAQARVYLGRALLDPTGAYVISEVGISRAQDTAATINSYLRWVAGQQLISGGALSPTGASTFEMTVGAGQVWGLHIELDPGSPHLYNFPGRGPVTFTIIDRDGVAYGAPTTLVPNTVWDDGGTITNVGNGRGTTHELYFSAAFDQFYLLMGQTEQRDLDDLTDNLLADTDRMVVPPLLRSGALKLGWVSITKDAAGLDDTLECALRSVKAGVWVPDLRVAAASQQMTTAQALPLASITAAPQTIFTLAPADSWDEGLLTIHLELTHSTGQGSSAFELAAFGDSWVVVGAEGTLDGTRYATVDITVPVAGAGAAPTADVTIRDGSGGWVPTAGTAVLIPAASR